MKNLILFLVLILLFSCKNNEKEYLSIIKENNEILTNELDTEIYILKIKSLEARGFFVEKYDNLSKIYNKINSIKNENDYKLVVNTIVAYGLKNKVKFDIKKIDSENIDVLKNNLLLNFKRFCDYIKIFRRQVNSTNCGPLGDHKWFNAYSYQKNDSINIDFDSKVTFSNYELVIDSIIENNSKISNYKSNSINKFWKIKYKPKSKNAIIYWKVFLHENNWNETILFEKSIDTISNKIK